MVRTATATAWVMRVSVRCECFIEGLLKVENVVRFSPGEAATHRPASSSCVRADLGSVGGVKSIHGNLKTLSVLMRILVTKLEHQLRALRLSLHR
jgi:hypothetical protein